MDGWTNLYCNMEVRPCNGCVSSCCSLEVDITKTEFNTLEKLGHIDSIITRSEIFIKEFPQYKNRRDFLDEMNGDTFAVIKQRPDGFCQLLDVESRLCSVYDNRPNVCRDFEANGPMCKSIKKCINKK